MHKNAQNEYTKHKRNPLLEPRNIPNNIVSFINTENSTNHKLILLDNTSFIRAFLWRHTSNKPISAMVQEATVSLTTDGWADGILRAHASSSSEDACIMHSK